MNPAGGAEVLAQQLDAELERELTLLLARRADVAPDARLHDQVLGDAPLEAFPAALRSPLTFKLISHLPAPPPPAMS